MDSPEKRAFDISTEAANVGFDWDDAQSVIPKLHEEVDEIANALKKGDEANLFEEVGDLFFALINFNRKAHIDSTRAFHAGVDKFERRFRRLETWIVNQGRDITDLSPDELEEIWALVKKEEHHAH